MMDNPELVSGTNSMRSLAVKSYKGRQLRNGLPIDNSVGDGLFSTESNQFDTLDVQKSYSRLHILQQNENRTEL